MSVQTLAVALLSADQADWLAPAAARLAARFRAHLIGTHAAEPVIVYGMGVASDPVLMPELFDWQKREAEDIGRAFEAAVKAEDIAGDYRFAGEFGATSEDYLLDSMRAADLVITGQIDRHGWLPQRARMQDALIRRVGRPVLVMPRGKPLAAAPERVLIGVSATRESTRAAHDALILAAPGAQIDLLGVGGGPRDTDEAFDIRMDMAAAFDRRGFKTNLVDRVAPAGETGEILLQVARELGAEMIAVGAFGHSRIYDFVIGAVTTHLLEKAALPVLFAK